MSTIFIKKLEDSLNSGELLKIISNSYAATSVSEALGYSKHNRYSKLVQDFCLLHNISTSHFTGNGKEPAKLLYKECPQCGNIFSCLGSSKETTTCSYACGNKYFAHTQGAKNRKTGAFSYTEFLARFYKNNNLLIKCCSCLESRVLDVHHIDENRDNNNIDNLVYLCPTHHAYLHRLNSEEVYISIANELDNRPLVK